MILAAFFTVLVLTRPCKVSGYRVNINIIWDIATIYHKKTAAIAHCDVIVKIWADLTEIK